MTENEKLMFFLAEEQQNLHHLARAMRELADQLPIRAEFVKQLKDEDIDLLDRFVFRFTKTVDAMGKRLFPELLKALGEFDETLFFRDSLNKLEKFGIVTSAEEWTTYRDRRNSLTHAYPEAEEEKAAAIMDAYEISFELINIYDRIKSLLSEKLGLAMQPFASPNTSDLPHCRK